MGALERESMRKGYREEVNEQRRRVRERGTAAKQKVEEEREREKK